MRLAQLLDMSVVQRLAEANYTANGMPIGIVDPVEGSVLVGCGWQDICLRFHRAHPRSLERCRESDRYLASHLSQAGPCEYRCQNGLRDIAIPIVVAGEQLGALFLGQFSYEGEVPDREFFVNQAGEFGYDEQEYLAALQRVPVFSRCQVENIIEYDKAFARFISDLAEGALRHLRDEEAIREREERYRSLFESSVDAIVALNLEGRYTDANPAALKMLGYTREELLKLSYQRLTPDRWRAVDETVLREQVAARGYSDNFEKEYFRRDGSVIPVSIRAFVTKDSVGRVVGNWAIVRDLTERKRAEEQFYHAQKMESVGRLAGGVAHDFNNLLTVILSGVEALKHDIRDGAPPDPEILDEVRDAGVRARDLTRQLLAFARRQVTSPVPLDLNALVRNSEKLLRRVLGEDVELGTTLQETLWPVRCDPGLIEQAVLNLAVNARDAMPRGGKLTIETANAEVDEAFTASRPWMRPGAYARLSVRDSGQGMSPEVLAHVFEPFFTTKPVGRGTGLGLAMIYGIVKQSGGYILVESAPGAGTTFDLYFPKTSDAPVATAPP